MNLAPHIKYKSCWIAVLVVLGLVGICLGILYIQAEILPIDRSDPATIVRSFADAMYRKNAGRAKALAIPELSERVEAWATKEYRGRDASFFEECIGGGAGGSLGRDQYSWGYSWFCGDASFSIHGIQAKRIDNEWWIVAWETVCEPYYDDC